MVADGDSAPDFTAPLADGDLGETFTLSERLEEAPLVLAFFPGAFSSVCTNEMNTFQERLGDFENVGASIYGISVDSPFALNKFRSENSIEYDFISDEDHEIVNSYGLTSSARLRSWDSSGGVSSGISAPPPEATFGFVRATLELS